ncbi:hypothetical protein ABZV67_37910 [Streptomyces sp. NPDC005065]|uniref:hypothetical protein n=1 Tax=unclassified Streptomyces TaxID=2593676 RepID=UPI0033B4C581
MTIDPVPTGPVDTGPRGFVPDPEQLKHLLAVLADAGIQLGSHDQRIAEWAAGWEWSTVSTIASWVTRATAETDQLRAERDQAIRHRDHWHAEARSANALIAELERKRYTLAGDPLAGDATEYRVPLPENGGTTLHVRRQAPINGAGWAVTVPGYSDGRAWTTDGWQESINALTVDRLFCWPDAATAVSEARRALAT